MNEERTAALEVQAVVKNFRRGRGLKKRITRAVDGATLTLARGELFGLLGPNGAGKTTLVRCIATLLIPDAGTIKVLGHDAFKDSLYCRQRIGLLTSGDRAAVDKLVADVSGDEKDPGANRNMSVLKEPETAVSRHAEVDENQVVYFNDAVHPQRADPDRQHVPAHAVGPDPQALRESLHPEILSSRLKKTTALLFKASA